MSEIFASRNFRELSHSRNFLCFAGIYFRESAKSKYFARIYFREFIRFFKNTHPIGGRFAKFAKISDIKVLLERCL